MKIRFDGGMGVRIVLMSAAFAVAGVMSSAKGAVTLITDGSFDDNAGGIPSHNLRPGAQGGWVWAGTAGIDTGNPYGTNNGSPAATNCVAFDSSPTTGVSQMGFIEGGGSGSGLSVAAQNFFTTVGQTYQIAFEAKAIAGGSGSTVFTVDPMFVSIFANGSLAAPLFGGSPLTPSAAGTDTNGYTHYSATFVATTTTEQLDFYDAGNQPGSEVTWIDAVAVTASVPEPVSMGMAAIGVAGLVGRRRRMAAGV